MCKKVALLVKTTFISRVVVEVPDDWNEKRRDELWTGDYIPLHGKLEDEIVNKVQTELSGQLTDASNVFENIEEVFNDIEYPDDADDLNKY